MRLSRYVIAGFFVVGINSAPVAQEACRSISDAAKRLECFDKRAPNKTEKSSGIRSKNAAAPPAMDKYRTKIIQQKSTIWNDPYSIREARIGEPQYCPTGERFPPGGMCICVEANAKNGYGGYTGVRRTLMIFAPDGHLTTSDGAILGYAEYCQDMRAFSQLNGDGR